MPVHKNEPMERTLPNETVVKWCPVCGSVGDHVCAGYPTGDDVAALLGAGHVAASAMNPINIIDDVSPVENAVLCEEVDAAVDDMTDQVFVRIRRAGVF